MNQRYHFYAVPLQLDSRSLHQKLGCGSRRLQRFPTVVARNPSAPNDAELRHSAQLPLETQKSSYKFLLEELILGSKVVEKPF